MFSISLTLTGTMGRVGGGPGEQVWSGAQESLRGVLRGVTGCLGVPLAKGALIFLVPTTLMLPK